MYDENPKLMVGASGTNVTLRDYFAAQAMSGDLAACAGNDTPTDLVALARWSYRMADALLNARAES